MNNSIENKPSRAKHIDFQISYKCMNNCIFCNYSFNMKRFGNYPYSLSEVKKILTEKAKKGFNSINFTGGEPTIIPNFTQVIKLAKQLGYRICVGTNAVKFADDKFFDSNIPFIDELVIAINGHNKSLDTIQTRNPENFENLCRALQKINDYKGNIILRTNTVMTKYSLEHIEDILEFIIGYKKVSHIILSNVSPEGAALNNYLDITPRLYDLREKIDKIVKIVKVRNIILRFWGYPLCILGDYKMLSDDLYLSPRIDIERAKRDGKIISAEVKVKTTARFRTKTDRCKKCIYNYDDICGGIHIEYYNNFGDKELQPHEE